MCCIQYEAWLPGGWNPAQGMDKFIWLQLHTRYKAGAHPIKYCKETKIIPSVVTFNYLGNKSTERRTKDWSQNLIQPKLRGDLGTQTPCSFHPNFPLHMQWKVGWHKFLLMDLTVVQNQAATAAPPVKIGMLRHAFLRVGEDISLQHILLHKCSFYPPSSYWVGLSACLLARACEGCNKGSRCNSIRRRRIKAAL